MTRFVRQFIRDAGVLSLSLLVAFALFMGIAILEAAFTEPSVGPTGGNPASPVDVGPNFQTKSGDLRVRNLFVDQLGPSGKYVSAILEGRERYWLTATRATVNLTVPLNMPTLYKLCRDTDGCRLTMGVKDFNPQGKPGLTASRGPIMLFISETAGSRWWRTSAHGFDMTYKAFVINQFEGTAIRESVFSPTFPNDCPTVFGDPDNSSCEGLNFSLYSTIGIPAGTGQRIAAGSEGRDQNSTIEEIFRVGDCRLTDGEYTTTGNSDLNEQWGLLNWGGATDRLFPATTTIECFLDIED